jgi:hypothetical protein
MKQSKNLRRVAVYGIAGLATAAIGATTADALIGNGAEEHQILDAAQRQPAPAVNPALDAAKTPVKSPVLDAGKAEAPSPVAAKPAPADQVVPPKKVIPAPVRKVTPAPAHHVAPARHPVLPKKPVAAKPKLRPSSAKVIEGAAQKRFIVQAARADAPETAVRAALPQRSPQLAKVKQSVDEAVKVVDQAHVAVEQAGKALDKAKQDLTKSKSDLAKLRGDLEKIKPTAGHHKHDRHENAKKTGHRTLTVKEPVAKGAKTVTKTATASNGNVYSTSTATSTNGSVSANAW